MRKGPVALLVAVGILAAGAPAFAGEATLPEDELITMLKPPDAAAGDRQVASNPGGRTVTVSGANPLKPFLESTEGKTLISFANAVYPDFSKTIQTLDPAPYFSKYYKKLEESGAVKFTYATTDIGAVDDFSKQVTKVYSSFKISSALVDGLIEQVDEMAAAKKVDLKDISMALFVLGNVKTKLEKLATQAQGLVTEGSNIPAKISAQAASDPFGVGMKAMGIIAGVQDNLKKLQTIAEDSPKLVDKVGKLADKLGKVVSGKKT